MVKYVVKVTFLMASKKAETKTITGIRSHSVYGAKCLGIGSALLDEHDNGRNRFVKLGSVHVEVDE